MSANPSEIRAEMAGYMGQEKSFAAKDFSDQQKTCSCMFPYPGGGEYAY